MGTDKKCKEGRLPFKDSAHVTGEEGPDRTDYLRITNVIAPFSGVEFVPERYLVPAAAKGTLVHNYIESKLAGFELPVDNDEIAPYLKSFDTFWDDSKHAFIGAKMTLEKRLYCDKHKISGKADCMIEFPDRTFIFDWKTSARPHLAWRLQAAGYRYLAEVNGYPDVKDIVFVKLNRYGKKPTLYKNINYDEDLPRFLSCLDIYRFFKMDTTRGWKDERR